MSVNLGWLSVTERKAFLESVKNEVKKEYGAKVKNLKIKALEDCEAKDVMISFLAPPQMAKNEYLEQNSAKFIFKCFDGDIQIPEYGILRTNFYYQSWVNYLGVLYRNLKNLIVSVS